MKRAMFIKRVKIGAGDALLYKLSDPVKFGGDRKTSDVIVSAITSPINGQEIKIAAVFPSDEDGKILSFEHVAETKGTLDHETPLAELGYEVM